MAGRYPSAEGASHAAPEPWDRSDHDNGRGISRGRDRGRGGGGARGGARNGQAGWRFWSDGGRGTGRDERGYERADDRGGRKGVSQSHARVGPGRGRAGLDEGRDYGAIDEWDRGVREGGDIGFARNDSRKGRGPERHFREGRGAREFGWRGDEPMNDQDGRGFVHDNRPYRGGDAYGGDNAYKRTRHHTARDEYGVGQRNGRYSERAEVGMPYQRSEAAFSGGNMKRKRHVPGGRIAKVPKQQEQDTDLFCVACDRYLPDVNGKALHDKSKDHRKALAHHRQILCDQDDDESVSSDDGEEDMMRVEAPKQFSKELVDKIWKQSNPKRWPKSFQSWANRSLEAARKLAKESNDWSINEAVEREIMVEFAVHTDNCTLLKESWDRKPNATGINWTSAEPKQYATHVIQETDVIPERTNVDDTRTVIPKHKNEISDNVPATTPPIPSNESNTNGHQFANARVRSTVRAPRPENPQWVRGSTEGHATPALTNGINQGKQTGTHSTRIHGGAVVRSHIERAVVTTHSQVEPGAGFEAGSLSSRVRVTVPAESSLPFVAVRQVDVTWQLPLRAQRILRACQGRDPLTVVAKCGECFSGLVKTASRKEQDDKGHVTIDALMTAYERAQSTFVSGEYKYEDLRKELASLAKQFEERGTRPSTLQRCYEMQVSAAILSERFGDCVEPSGKLVRLYDGVCRNAETLGEFTGHWVLSLLLRSDMDAPLPGAARQRRAEKMDGLSLACRLRDMPRRATMNIATYDALRVFKAILNNNYVSFLSLYRNSVSHHKTGMRSKYMMDAFMEVMQHRALLLLGTMSHATEDNVFHFPKHLPLRYVMDVLGWRKEDDFGEVQYETESARACIDKVGLKTRKREGMSKSEEQAGTEECLTAYDQPSLNVPVSSWVDLSTVVPWAHPEHANLLHANDARR